MNSKCKRVHKRFKVCGHGLNSSILLEGISKHGVTSQLLSVYLFLSSLFFHFIALTLILDYCRPHVP